MFATARPSAPGLGRRAGFATAATAATAAPAAPRYTMATAAPAAPRYTMATAAPRYTMATAAKATPQSFISRPGFFNRFVTAAPKAVIGGRSAYIASPGKISSIEKEITTVYNEFMNIVKNANKNNELIYYKIHDASGNSKYEILLSQIKQKITKLAAAPGKSPGKTTKIGQLQNFVDAKIRYVEEVDTYSENEKMYIEFYNKYQRFNLDNYPTFGEKLNELGEIIYDCISVQKTFGSGNSISASNRDFKVLFDKNNEMKLYIETIKNALLSTLKDIINYQINIFNETSDKELGHVLSKFNKLKLFLGNILIELDSISIEVPRKSPASITKKKNMLEFLVRGSNQLGKIEKELDKFAPAYENLYNNAVQFQESIEYLKSYIENYNILVDKADKIDLNSSTGNIKYSIDTGDDNLITISNFINIYNSMLQNFDPEVLSASLDFEEYYKCIKDLIENCDTYINSGTTLLTSPDGGRGSPGGGRGSTAIPGMNIATLDTKSTEIEKFSETVLQELQKLQKDLKDENLALDPGAYEVLVNRVESIKPFGEILLSQLQRLVQSPANKDLIMIIQRRLFNTVRNMNNSLQIIGQINASAEAAASQSFWNDLPAPPIGRTSPTIGGSSRRMIPNSLKRQIEEVYNNIKEHIKNERKRITDLSRTTPNGQRFKTNALKDIQKASTILNTFSTVENGKLNVLENKNDNELFVLLTDLTNNVILNIQAWLAAARENFPTGSSINPVVSAEPDAAGIYTDLLNM
jgi:hypothetical protein